MVCESFPLGPSILTTAPSIFAVTPLGMLMGLFPILLMADSFLPECTDDLPADLLLARLFIGENAL
jgi:hypothetical protein